MRTVSRLVVVAFSFLTLEASAQIFKCTDPTTGRTTFTDSACPDNSAGDFVPVAPTNVESGYLSGKEFQKRQAEREAADRSFREQWQSANEDIITGNTVDTHSKRAEQLRSQAKRENDNDRRAKLLKRAEEEENVARRAAGLPPVERSKKPSTHPNDPEYIPSPPRPSVITNCDSAGCWDDVGNRYNKGAGETYFRNDGKVCQSVAGTVICN